jgi:hypothetical protein
MFISIGTLVVARSARRAAREAKNAIESRTLTQELRACGDDVTRLTLFSHGRQWDLAMHTCSSAMNHVTFIDSRWSQMLDRESRTALLKVIDQLDTLHAKIQGFTLASPNEEAVADVLISVSRVSRLLAAQAGRSESRVVDRIGGQSL